MSQPQPKLGSAASSATAPPPVPTLPHLLTLPVELRLDIYDLILKSTVFYISGSLDHPLLHINAQIRDECLPIFFKAVDSYQADFEGYCSRKEDKAMHAWYKYQRVLTITQHMPPLAARLLNRSEKASCDEVVKKWEQAIVGCKVEEEKIKECRKKWKWD